MLDSLQRTSPGPDNLPFWFLRVLAPFLAKPLSQIYNLSINQSFIPEQWKCSTITPVAKVARPTVCAEYRPISVTPIMSRLLEKVIVKDYIYPALIHPACTHLFHDQFAFRPTGSTTAALVSLIHKISSLLVEYPYVHVIALDFSKAFDTVRHSTLLAKCADLPIEDAVYNWLMSFLDNRTHCTKFTGCISCLRRINASIVQGSGIGPVTYVISASDLCPLHKGNSFDKYADDSYLIVPSVNSSTIAEELEHIAKWAHDNNLKLNRSKTKEIVVHRPRAKNLLFPPAVDGVERLDVINVLGVLVDSTLSFRAQVDRLVGQSAQTLYALRILKHHGLCGPPLWNVATATLLSRLLYASPVWWGMVDAGGRHRLQSVLNKAVKQGFLPKDQASLELLCDSADMKLFASILRNPQHVLHQFLPPVKHTTHNLRSRAHNRVLPNVKDSLFRKTFINRMIFHDCY